VTGGQVIAAIRACALKLGRTPTREEFVSTTNVSARTVRNRFGSYTRALNAAGLELPNNSPKIDMQELFLDWAALARAQGRVPSLPYYQQNSKFSVRPLLYRFGNWTQVPFGMQAFAERQGLEAEFQDVLEMVQTHRRATERATAQWNEEQTSSLERPAGLWPTCNARAPGAWTDERTRSDLSVRNGGRATGIHDDAFAGRISRWRGHGRSRTGPVAAGADRI
jgi:hypothetical protein